MMRTIAVLIADDDRGTRALIRQRLAAEKGIMVVAEAGNGEIAVELTKQYLPDVVIADIEMPVLDGFAASREILAVVPGTGIIIYSATRDPAAVERSFATGARGFVRKGHAHQLATAIRVVFEGRLYLGP